MGRCGGEGGRKARKETRDGKGRHAEGQKENCANAVCVRLEISDEAVERLVQVMDEVLGPKPLVNGTEKEEEKAQEIRELEFVVE